MICLVIAVSFIIPCAVTAAGDFEEGESFTGFKFGVLGPGQVDLGSQNADQKTSFGGGVFFDFPFGAHFHYGASADLYRMHWTADGERFNFDSEELLLDVGINVKASLSSENSSFAFRPGVGIGFGALRRMAGFGGSNYLTLKAFSEAVYFTPGELAFLLDAGVWYAPSGGDNEHDIKIGPLFLIRAGVMF
jgi:hypothetical protein